jgi:hypothetical protein
MESITQVPFFLGHDDTHQAFDWLLVILNLPETPYPSGYHSNSQSENNLEAFKIYWRKSETEGPN